MTVSVSKFIDSKVERSSISCIYLTIQFTVRLYITIQFATQKFLHEEFFKLFKN